LGNGRREEANQGRAERADQHLMSVPEVGRNGRGERQAEAKGHHPEERPQGGMDGRQREEKAKPLVAKNGQRLPKGGRGGYRCFRSAHATRRSLVSWIWLNRRSSLR